MSPLFVVVVPLGEFMFWFCIPDCGIVCEPVDGVVGVVIAPLGCDIVLLDVTPCVDSPAVVCGALACFSFPPHPNSNAPKSIEGATVRTRFMKTSSSFPKNE
jgi:hypothetical protein